MLPREEVVKILNGDYSATSRALGSNRLHLLGVFKYYIENNIEGILDRYKINHIKHKDKIMFI